MFGHRIKALVAVAAAASLGCPGGGGGGGGTTPDPNPPTFSGGPPLAEPPAGDAGAFGYGYLKRMSPRLQDRWRGFLENCQTRLPPAHPFNQTSLAVVLALEVAASGELADVRVVGSSGNAEFDEVALEVVRDAGAFPEAPRALVSDDGLVHVQWRFARDDRQAGLAGASLERIEWEPARSVPMLIEAGRLAEAARRIDRAASDGAAGEASVALLDGVAAAALRAGLESDDVEAIRAAVFASARARFSEAAPRLRALATSAVDLELRREAAAALGAIGDADAVPVLVGILAGEGEGEYRGAAARALHALGAGDRAWQALEPALASDGKDEQLSALVVLSYFPASDAVPRLARLLEGPSDRSVRLAAAAALGAAIEVAGHKAAKPLVTGLGQRDAAVRGACAQALADAARAGYRSKIAYWETIKLLKDKDDRVRAAAANAGALLGGAGFAKEMYRLRKESSPVVLAALAGGLGGVPGKDALERLLGLADSDDSAIRRAVARALAMRTEPEARQRLAAWIADGDLEVRLAAIAASEDGDRVRGLLDGDAPRVQLEALDRVIRLDGRPAALAATARLLAVAPSPEARASLAGVWLSRR